MEKGFYGDKEAYEEIADSLENVLCKLVDSNREQDRAAKVIQGLLNMIVGLIESEEK